MENDLDDCENVKRAFSKRTNSFYKTVFNEERLLKELDRKAELQSQKNANLVDEKRDNDISEHLRAELNREHLEKKHCQRLRKDCQELRTLNRQLGAAMVFKVLKEQKAGTLLIRGERLNQKRTEDRDFEAEHARYMQDEHDKFLVEHKRKKEHRDILLQQIEEIQQKRRLTQAELVEDQRRLDALMAKYAEMDAELLAKKEQAKVDLRTALDDMMESKRNQRNEDHDKEVQVIERSMAVQRKREEEKQAAMREKKRQMDARAAFSFHIGQVLQDERDDQLQRDRVLEDLLIQEKKYLADEKVFQHNYGQMLYRKQLNMELQDNNLANEARKKFEYETELRRRKADDAKLTEIMRAEAIARVEKKRQATRDVCAALNDAMARKNYERERRLAETVAHEQYRIREEEKLRESIDVERLRILREQPMELLEHVQRGVMTRAEREELGLPVRD